MSAAANKLRTALHREIAVNAVPCDGCRSAPRCRQHHWACEAFVIFASGGGRKQWAAAPRAPTRAIHDAFFDV